MFKEGYSLPEYKNKPLKKNGLITLVAFEG